MGTLPANVTFSYDSVGACGAPKSGMSLTVAGTYEIDTLTGTPLRITTGPFITSDGYPFNSYQYNFITRTHNFAKAGTDDRTLGTITFAAVDAKVDTRQVLSAAAWVKVTFNTRCN